MLCLYTTALSNSPLVGRRTFNNRASTGQYMIDIMSNGIPMMTHKQLSQRSWTHYPLVASSDKHRCLGHIFWKKTQVARKTETMFTCSDQNNHWQPTALLWWHHHNTQPFQNTFTLRSIYRNTSRVRVTSLTSSYYLSHPKNCLFTWNWVDSEKTTVWNSC